MGARLAARGRGDGVEAIAVRELEHLGLRRGGSDVDVRGRRERAAQQISQHRHAAADDGPVVTPRGHHAHAGEQARARRADVGGSGSAEVAVDVRERAGDRRKVRRRHQVGRRAVAVERERRRERVELGQRRVTQPGHVEAVQERRAVRGRRHENVSGPLLVELHRFGAGIGGGEQARDLRLDDFGLRDRAVRRRRVERIVENLAR